MASKCLERGMKSHEVPQRKVSGKPVFKERGSKLIEIKPRKVNGDQVFIKGKKVHRCAAKEKSTASRRYLKKGKEIR